MNLNYDIGFLAGGRSKRFGSNKALLRVSNICFLSRLISDLSLIGAVPNSILISLHDRSELEGLLNVLRIDLKLEINSVDSVIKDIQKRFSLKIKFVFDCDSPLYSVDTRAAMFGIHTIMEKSQAEYIQFLPCDTPLFHVNIVDKICQLMAQVDNEYDAIIPRWENGFLEPLHGLYRVETYRDSVQQLIRSQKYRLIYLYSNPVRIHYFPIEPILKENPSFSRSFVNINELNVLNALLVSKD